MDLGSNMADLKAHEPFKVPQNYFRLLPERINDKLFQPKSIFPALRTGKMVLRSSLALAGIMIIAYLILVPIRNKINNGNLYSDMETYLLENMDESTLIEMYEEVSGENPVKDNMESYLLENIDENLLIEEL